MKKIVSLKITHFVLCAIIFCGYSTCSKKFIPFTQNTKNIPKNITFKTITENEFNNTKEDVTFYNKLGAQNLQLLGQTIKGRPKDIQQIIVATTLARSNIDNGTYDIHNHKLAKFHIYREYLKNLFSLHSAQNPNLNYLYPKIPSEPIENAIDTIEWLQQQQPGTSDSFNKILKTFKDFQKNTKK